jgi:hypothetical protein
VIRTVVKYLPSWLAVPLRRLWRGIYRVLAWLRGATAGQADVSSPFDHVTGDNLRAVWRRFRQDPYVIAFSAGARVHNAGLQEAGLPAPARTARPGTISNSIGLSTIRYEDHPAFAGVPFNDDPQIEMLCRELSAALDVVRERAKLPSTNVVHQMTKRVVPAAEQLFAALTEKYRTIDVFGGFAQRLKQKLVELAAEDLAVCADRGTHAYIDHSPQADAITEALHGSGFWLGWFDPASVKLLNEAVARTKVLLQQRHQSEGRTDRETLSTNVWDAESNHKLAAVFNEPAIITGISNYMGASYAYSGCGFELSVPGTTWWRNRYGSGNESRETAYYHVDQSSQYPKLICYLSDVTEENGPTSLVSVGLSQSLLSSLAGRALDGISVDPDRGVDTNMAKMLVSTEAGRLCFGALPKEMRCLGHFGNDILAGSSEERYIVSNRSIMLGSAGTFVVFDGSRTAHRGGIVRSSNRWAFQVVYARVR